MPSITGIAHVELSVRDLDESSRWYCELLGAREVFRERNEAECLDACAIYEPASRLVLAFTRHDSPIDGAFNARRHGLDHLSFAVASLAELEQWRNVLDARRIAHSEIGDLGYAYNLTFADPDGIALEFFVSRPA